MATLRLFDADSDPIPIDPGSLTCAEVVALYMRHAAIENVHGDVAKAERERILPQFLADIGTLLVVDAKPYHLTDWIESRPQWKSVSTRRAKANQVRAAFNWAFETERITRHPFRTCRYSEAEPRPPMEDETLNLFTHHANKKMEAALHFLRFTGCRTGELCKAKWEHINFDRGEWVVPDHKTRKKTLRPKYIALVAGCLDLLRSLDRVSDYVFVNNRGNPWKTNTLGTAFRWLRKRHKIGEGTCLHSIRHGAASAMLGAGAPIKMVAEQLGHSRVDTLERHYYTRSPAHLEAMKAAVELGLPHKSE